VVKHHGVHYLEKKQTKLKISETNKNDAMLLLGPPSTKNIFENDIWIYIERKTTVSDLKSFGKKKLMVNNVLVLEFDNRGLLVKKEFYDQNQMNKLKISENNTNVVSKDKNLINTVLRTLKQKINDPLGKRKIK
jgi:outer membrane protein assembly factor BamE (lipoprotein component of BamABCDE complex)